MFGSLALGAFVFQTILVVGGPDSGTGSAYDPILDVVRSVTTTKAKRHVRVERAPAPKKEVRSPRSERGKAGVGIMDASSRKLGTTQARPATSRSTAFTLALVRQNLRTAEERRILLPVLRRLRKAEWHLGRGMRQGRTDLRTSAELRLAVREFERTRLDLPQLTSRQQDSPHLVEALRRVKALANQGAIEAWLAQAHLDLKQGSPRAAGLSLRAILELAPSNARALTLKARIDKIIAKPGS